MLILTPEQLEFVLREFRGTPVDPSVLRRSPTKFFSDPEKIIYPQVSFTTHLDITRMYATYVNYYKNTPGATFTAYMKWTLLKSMEDTPLTWRYINNHWYEFKNLPLEIAVYVGGKEGVLLCYLNNASSLNWENFCKKHAEIATGTSEDYKEKLSQLPLHLIAYEIVGLNIPGKLTSYETTIKVGGSHQPWIVFNKRFTKSSGEIIQPLRISFSHAALLPAAAGKFVEKFMELAETIPAEMQNVRAKL